MNTFRPLPPPDYKMQMIIIGDSGVGKTSFMDRFVEGNHQVKTLSHMPDMRCRAPKTPWDYVYVQLYFCLFSGGKGF